MQHINITLYGTEHCHLCEEAVEIIHGAGLAMTFIDIVDDDNFFDKYSTRIPVLHRADKHTELDWPFDALAVLKFIS